MMEEIEKKENKIGNSSENKFSEKISQLGLGQGTESILLRLIKA